MRCRGKRRKMWIQAVNRKNWGPSKDSRICSEHFIKKEPSRVPTDPDYVPSVFNHTAKKHTPKRQQEAVSRFNRAKERNQKKTSTLSTTQQIPQNDNLVDRHEDRDNNEQLVSEDEAIENETSANVSQFGSVGTQTTCADVLYIAQLECKVAHLESQVAELEVQLQETQNMKFGHHVLKDNDKLTTIYTGLPSYAIFMWLVGIVRSSLPSSKLLSPENLILMILIKLKLAVPFMDLGLRFGVSESTLSKKFGPGICAMEKALSFLIVWPSKHAVKKHMPAVLKNYGGLVRSIIDCTEWYIERPKKLKARAQTWSNYKHHNTFKFFVSITPTGAVSFVSECWGGRVSDKKLTQECGYLDKLEPGDVILADRGFLIEDDLKVRGAKLHIPAFTKGKKQLSRREVEETRKIARTRIHVERAIGRLKRYRILQINLPISFSHHCNSIVNVICSLCNLLPPLVQPKIKKKVQDVNGRNV